MAVPVTPDYKVNTGKSKKTQEFGFHMSAKLAKTLAETLYNHKMDAVVREYSTNIVDSHTDAGIPDEKGYVHIPTTLEPYLKFIDKGVGMSEEDIFNIFTVFGKSTKTHDNTTNGSLGYGAKSAFTVCDQFTVTSVKNGVKNVVVCYKDNKGYPTSSLKSSTETTEVNGTTITIPVKQTSIRVWQSVCARVLGAFRNPPETNGFGDYQEDYEQVKEVCKVVRDSGVYISFKRRYHFCTNHMVLMGDVLYNLPEIKKLVGNTEIKDTIVNILRDGTYIAHFDIGVLDHSPSRESISYDDQTLRKVKRRLNHDINLKFRSMLSCEDSTVNNMYKFYHRYYGTDTYEALGSYKLPFTKGYCLTRITPYKNYKDKNKVYLLEGLVGNIKGVVPSVSSPEYMVYNTYVNKLSQSSVIFGLRDPVITYSEKVTGVYKIKDTLFKIKDEKHKPVLLVDNKEKAEILLNWFGEGEVLCADPYSPEKTSKKVQNKHQRESFGVKSDYETVGVVLRLTEKGYTKRFQKINLKGEGVYYVTDNVEIKGLVPNVTTHLKDISDSDLLNIMLKAVGGKEVVVLNNNNKGKIERSGVPSLKEALVQKLKKEKRNMIKYLGWKKQYHNLNKRESLLVRGTTEHKKYEKLKEDSMNAIQNRYVEDLCSILTLKLEDTKLYKQKFNQASKVISDLECKIENIKENLPLYSSISNLSDLEYYLKLEKIIK